MESSILTGNPPQPVEPTRRQPPGAALRGRLADVARNAEGLEVLEVPRCAAVLQRYHVIHLKPRRDAAPDTPPSVALEHEPAHRLPPRAGHAEPLVDGAHPAMPERTRRGAGARASAPAASTNAWATSSRATFAGDLRMRTFPASSVFTAATVRLASSR